MSELSDVGQAQRSKALTPTGQIAEARGNPPAALRAYREAYDGTAEALRRDPTMQRLYEMLKCLPFGDIVRSRVICRRGIGMARIQARDRQDRPARSGGSQISNGSPLRHRERGDDRLRAQDDMRNQEGARINCPADGVDGRSTRRTVTIGKPSPRLCHGRPVAMALGKIDAASQSSTAMSIPSS